MEIAVAIPFYNEEKTILKTLNSFLYPPFLKKAGFVLVNNNSTDKSVELVKKFKRQNPKIKLKIYEEAKQSVAYARKTALDLALKLKPQIIVGADADNLFNNKILKEILNFSKNNNYEIFMGRSSIEPKLKLKRLVIFPDFARLITILWNQEYKIFGVYFFGACFALKAGFYQKVSPFYNVDKSLVIYQESGEDILLSRRCYYMNGRFLKSNEKIIISGRRFFAEPLNWITGERASYQNIRNIKSTKISKKTITKAKTDKVNLLKQSIKNSLTRWFRYFTDAVYFYYETDKKYPKALTASQNFTNFFNIPRKEIKKTKSKKKPKNFLKELNNKYFESSFKLLKDFCFEKLKQYEKK